MTNLAVPSTVPQVTIERTAWDFPQWHQRAECLLADVTVTGALGTTRFTATIKCIVTSYEGDEPELHSEEAAADSFMAALEPVLDRELTADEIEALIAALCTRDGIAREGGDL